MKNNDISKKDLTCCFTGHRLIPQEIYRQIQKRLECEIEKLILKGVIYYGTGGALGFDTIAAQTVLKLRKKHLHIKNLYWFYLVKNKLKDGKILMSVNLNG